MQRHTTPTERERERESVCVYLFMCYVSNFRKVGRNVSPIPTQRFPNLTIPPFRKNRSWRKDIQERKRRNRAVINWDVIGSYLPWSTLQRKKKNN